MRFARRKATPRGVTAPETVRVGFVPTLDCASLVAAQELGLYARHGLRVQLSREIGWATTRDKLINGELDAIAAHASLLLSLYCGWNGVRRPSLTGLLLAGGGSAITLARSLSEAGVSDATSLGRAVREGRLRRPPILGVPLELASCTSFLLRWLRRGGIDPEREVRLAVVPPGLVLEALAQGHLDGFCDAEPWNSAAVARGVGWVAAVCAEPDSVAADKALVVLREFAEERDEEHLRLLAALIEAGRFCAAPGNRPALVRMLAQPRYLDVDPSVLERSLRGPVDSGAGWRERAGLPGLDPGVMGAPTRDQGRALLEVLGELPRARVSGMPRKAVLSRIFRGDLFDRALARCDGEASERGGGGTIFGVRHLQTHTE